MRLLALTAMATVAAALPEVFMGRKTDAVSSQLRAERFELLNAGVHGMKNLTQKLDHFDSSNTNTWDQRYFFNHEYVKPDTNVNILYICGEQSNSLKTVVDDTKSYVYYAKQLSGDLYSFEHRFYGRSHPTKDTSVESLQYLSSMQAIEDIAEFIRQINAQKGGGDQKWITIGGSYSGALSAWARLKHPELIAGSVASSAPILAQVDFYGYLQTVDEEFKKHGGLCYDQIRDAFDAAQNLIQSEEGRATLADIFQITPPFSAYDEITPYDIETFFSQLTGPFRSAAQYNNPPIDKLCETFTANGPDYDPLRALKLLIRGKMDINFTATIEQWSGEEFKPFDIMGKGESIARPYLLFMSLAINEANRLRFLITLSTRLWIYQTCTELGYFQSTNQGSNVFGSTLSANVYIEHCVRLFGIDADQIQRGIDATNERYGGRDYYAGTNVIFSHGTQDPYSFLTKNSDPKHWSVVIVEIEGELAEACTPRTSVRPASRPPSIARIMKMIQIQTLTLENMRRWIDPIFPVPDRVEITDNVSKRPQFFDPYVRPSLSVNAPVSIKLRAKRSIDVPKNMKKPDFTKWNRFTCKGSDGILPTIFDMTQQPDVAGQDWINQTWDHFNANEERVFKQKWYYNYKFGSKDGPNFLVIGMEVPATGNYIKSEDGNLLQYAKAVGANVFNLEHRYYGESKLVTTDLQFLTSAQMLYDVATFIRTQQVKHNRTGPWITFGCSYAGNLAAWSREWFPELIVGAVGTSAPLLAKTDFSEYMKVVEDVIQRQSQKCYDRTAEAFDSLYKLTQSPEGRAIIQDKFNLWPGWTSAANETIDTLDISKVFNGISAKYADTVQYNAVDWSTVAQLCSFFENDAVDSLDALSALIGDEHLLSSYDVEVNDLIDKVQFIDGHDDTYSDQELAEPLWIWQTCNEFGYFQSTDYGHGIFGTPVSVNYFIVMCERVFGIGMDHIEKGVARANYQYGGSNRYNAKNVVLPFGDADPWHVLGLQERDNLDESVVPILISGTSHCADSLGATAADPPELTRARKTILDKIQRWLAPAPYPTTPAVQTKKTEPTTMTTTAETNRTTTITVSPTTSSSFSSSILLPLILIALISVL